MSEDSYFRQSFGNLGIDLDNEQDDEKNDRDTQKANVERVQSEVQGGDESELDPALAESEEATAASAPPSDTAAPSGAVERESAVNSEGLSDEDVSTLDYASDVFKQVVGGVSDAGENIGNAVKETVFGETRDEFGNIVKTFDFPDLGPPTTTAGEITRPIAEFLIPFVATAGAVGAAAKSFQFLNFLRSGGVVRNSILQGSIAGAVTDYAALDPADGNLSTMLKDIPAVQSFVPDIFVHNESDTQFEKRMKSVVEGAAIGAVAEGLFHGFRMVRAQKKTKRFQLAYGTEKSATEIARVTVSNLVHARRTFVNIEAIADSIDKLSNNDTAFREAISYLESVERVGGRPNEIPLKYEDFDNLEAYEAALKDLDRGKDHSSQKTSIIWQSITRPLRTTKLRALWTGSITT